MKLSPTLEESILVVGGRLKHSSLSQRSKCPIILPYGHTLSQMIVLSYHNDAHLGTEWVLSKIRCKFWIVNARKLVKKIKRQCVTCKRLYAAPLGQRMADLPPERCQPGETPFKREGNFTWGVELIKCIDPNEGEALRRGSTFKPGGLAPPTPLFHCLWGRGGGREGGRREGGYRLIISVSWLSTTETHAHVTPHFR